MLGKYTITKNTDGSYDLYTVGTGSDNFYSMVRIAINIPTNVVDIFMETLADEYTAEFSLQDMKKAKGS